MTDSDHPLVIWRKSSYSGEQGGECVEVAAGERVILARDSKNPEGGVLSFSRAEWAAFSHAVKLGQGADQGSASGS